jgi:hypothetical protein
VARRTTRTADLVATDPGDESPEDAADRTRTEKVQTFLRQSRDRWRTADAASDKLRKRMRMEQLFAAGDQWDEHDRSLRADEGRPCLTINRIPQFLRQVSNQSRANRSQILVAPKGKDASVELANTLQGLIRSVEVDSDADVAYDTASDHQLRIGLGYVRLRAKWDGETWEQHCRIERIRNPLSVYKDPTTQEADFADARFMHIIGVIGKDEYQARWGHLSDYASLVEFVKYNKPEIDWMPEGRVVLAEYFTVEQQKKKLCLLEDGASVREENLGKYAEAFQMANPGAPLPAITRTRQHSVPVVSWCLHNATTILEGNADRTAGRELPGTRIPIFPVVGDELDLDGTVDYRGMVTDAVDPAKMYNFWTSAIAETIALTTKAPWIAAAGQISEYLEEWEDSNRTPHAVLQYDPVSVNGDLAPPPTRNVAEPPIQAMVVGLKESDQDIKAVMGLFEASLGEKGPQQSARAISAVQQQGLLANSNYLDNLQRTKRSLGRALLVWLRVIYDVPRIVHIVQPDGKRQKVIVHAGPDNAPAVPQAPAPKGFQVNPQIQPFDAPPDVRGVFDISAGDFEISVSTGPSFQTQREETEAWLLELFKVLPGLAQIGADIVLENSDNPAAQQLAKRAKLMLPPQLQDETDPETALPRLTAQNQQLQQLLAKQHTAISALVKKLESQQISADARIQVALIQAQSQRDIVMAKIGSDKDREIFQAEYNRFEQMVGHLSDLAQGSADHDHALEQGAQAAALAPQPDGGGGDNGQPGAGASA